MTGRCWRFLYAERTLENRPVNKNTMSLCCKKVPGSLDRKNEERMIKRKKKVKEESYINKVNIEDPLERTVNFYMKKEN